MVFAAQSIDFKATQTIHWKQNILRSQQWMKKVNKRGENTKWYSLSSAPSRSTGTTQTFSPLVLTSKRQLTVEGWTVFPWVLKLQRTLGNETNNFVDKMWVIANRAD